MANCLNQYTNVEYSTVQPSTSNLQPLYDADGNQTLVKTSTGVWSVTYNGENRPICWSNGATVVTMDFDSMGRRTFYRENVNGVQTTFTRFFYDGYLMIQQLYSNTPYNVYKEFIWDPTEPIATKPLCFRQNGQTATFLTHDGNKNVTDVIRVSPYNDSVGHYDYAPFGAVRSQTGARASANPYRFSSEFFDDTLGLVYYNYRHYEPVSGRWMSRDPIGDLVPVAIPARARKAMYKSYAPKYSFEPEYTAQSGYGYHVMGEHQSLGLKYQHEERIGDANEYCLTSNKINLRIDQLGLFATGVNSCVVAMDFGATGLFWHAYIQIGDWTRGWAGLTYTEDIKDGRVRCCSEMERRKDGVMPDGSPCGCASSQELQSCVKNSDNWPYGEYCLWGRNCGTWVREVANRCCLKAKFRAPWFAPNAEGLANIGGPIFYGPSYGWKWLNTKK